MARFESRFPLSESALAGRGWLDRRVADRRAKSLYFTYSVRAAPPRIRRVPDLGRRRGRHVCDNAALRRPSRGGNGSKWSG